MFCTGRHDINPSRVCAAVAQNIRQLGDVLLNAVKGAGKQLAQIVWKYLAGFDVGGLAEGFHLSPDIASVERLSASRDEDRAGGDAAFLCIIQQQLSQLAGEQDRPRFALAAHRDFSALHRLHREEPQLRHPDAGATDGLQDQPKLGAMLCRRQQPQVFGLCQLLLFGTVGLALGFQILYLAVLQPQKIQQAVETGQHGVDGAHRIALFDQAVFIGHHQFFFHILLTGINKKKHVRPGGTCPRSPCSFLPGQDIDKNLQVSFQLKSVYSFLFPPAF